MWCAGFNINLTPGFSPARLAFMLGYGGILAVANLRSSPLSTFVSALCVQGCKALAVQVYVDCLVPVISVSMLKAFAQHVQPNLFMTWSSFVPGQTQLQPHAKPNKHSHAFAVASDFCLFELVTEWSHQAASMVGSSPRYVT